MFLNCLTETLNQCEKVKRYLYEYGYLQEEDDVSLRTINDTVLSNALLIFQEYYKLPIDGKLNNETRINVQP